MPQRSLSFFSRFVLAATPALPILPDVFHRLLSSRAIAQQRPAGARYLIFSNNDTHLKGRP
ncbi:hypothetical protein [Herbaspirillum sp. RV1423]|uniref:hypothetical protein n=1 Tax=Herbaspirillum sp. RV1423 TaxID=1443993 RepID=UPI0012DED399|nr:hypothetical protein [Herbaspirillum sp. RV1423]